MPQKRGFICVFLAEKDDVAYAIEPQLAETPVLQKMFVIARLGSAED